MTSDRGSRSLLESPCREGVWHRPQQRLTRRLATPQSVKTDRVGIQIDVGADQAMQPVLVDEKGSAQQRDPSAGIGAAKKDDHSGGGLLEVQSPPSGKASSWKCRVDAWRTAMPEGGDVSRRPLGERAKRVMLEAGPDLRLPLTIEALDGRLETGLVGDGKHRRDAKTEAQPNDPPDTVAVLFRSGKAVVVVELGVCGKANGSPVFHQGLDHGFGGKRALGPDGREPTAERNCRKNREVRPATDRQPLDGVEAVQLGFAGRDLRQVPAARWWRATRASTTIENAMALKNTADGTHGRARAQSACLQLAPDRRSSVLAQDAVLLQRAPQLQDQLFDRRIGASGALGYVRTISPTNAIEPQPVSPFEPALHGAKRDAESPRDLALRGSPANRRHDLASPAAGGVFEP